MLDVSPISKLIFSVARRQTLRQMADHRCTVNAALLV